MKISLILAEKTERAKKRLTALFVVFLALPYLLFLGFETFYLRDVPAAAFPAKGLSIWEKLVMGVYAFFKSGL